MFAGVSTPDRSDQYAGRLPALPVGCGSGASSAVVVLVWPPASPVRRAVARLVLGELDIE